jgi:hypothetical protein
MPHIVELEPFVWLGTCEGDPSRTCQVGNANRYVTESLANAALDAARRYRPFANAKTVEVPE